MICSDLRQSQLNNFRDAGKHLSRISWALGLIFLIQTFALLSGLDDAETLTLPFVGITIPYARGLASLLLINEMIGLVFAIAVTYERTLCCYLISKYEYYEKDLWASSSSNYFNFFQHSKHFSSGSQLVMIENIGGFSIASLSMFIPIGVLYVAASKLYQLDASIYEFLLLGASIILFICKLYLLLNVKNDRNNKPFEVKAKVVGNKIVFTDTK
ncbi:MAG: hypothetical protein HAW67_01270 [Endozoicomonadaceae bacterium]|nr:hypothetical protein [Endozoicomonadaceae bacterium]